MPATNQTFTARNSNDMTTGDVGYLVEEIRDGVVSLAVYDHALRNTAGERVVTGRLGEWNNVPRRALGRVTIVATDDEIDGIAVVAPA